MERRLQIDHSGPFFTIFLTHSWAMGLQIWQKLSSLGPIFADRRPKSDRLLVIGNNQAMNWLDKIKWDAQGLIPVIAQEVGSNDVLMFAWMNREALAQTAKLGRAVYYSRSRSRLWPKGEESGHVQTVHEIRMDCDNDVLLLKVTQLGHGPASPSKDAPAQSIACHTGRHSCFFSLLKDEEWQIVDPVLKDPKAIYR